MSTYYERISYIARKCLENHIPFEIKPLFDGWQIRFSWADNADAAAHFGTYQAANGKVETYHFPWDKDDVSIFSPENAFINIQKLWLHKENPFL